MVIAPWRRALLCCLVVSPVILLGSGCKTAGGWRAPWSAWSGASSPGATALNISKPSTQAPSPNSTPGQPNRGIAASGGPAASGGNPSGVAMTGATSPANPVSAYPATPQADAFPEQTAGNSQHGPGAEGQVAPAGGMQVGPYSMQSKPAANSYGASPRTNAPAAAEGPYGNGEDNRTADRGNAGNYGGAPAAEGAENSQANEAGSVYGGGGGGAATATESSVYGSDEETSPAGGNNGYAPTNYTTNETPAAPAASRSFGPPNTVAPRPSTSPPSSSGTNRTSLPSSLSTSGGYRPGSTGGYGASNAGYNQPQNASNADGAVSGGVYR